MRWKAVKKIHRVFLTTFCSECCESRWIIYFHGILGIIKKTLLDKWLEPLTSWMFSTLYSTAPTLMYFYHIACEFRKTLETECSEFLSEMRWKTVKKFHRVFLTSFYSECGELQWIIFFHGILGIIKKALLDKWLKPLTYWFFPTPFSTAPTLMYFYYISCDLIKR